MWDTIPKFRKAGKKMTIQDLKRSKHVVYASNGICFIEDVKKLTFIKGEPEKTYYILRPLNDKNSTIYIPENNELLLGRIRSIITKDEIDAIIRDTKTAEFVWIEDRKQRSAHYRELLSAPHPAVLLPLMKSIATKKAELAELGKKLAAVDRDTYEISLRFVKDEFAFALNYTERDAIEHITRALGEIAEMV